MQIGRKIFYVIFVVVLFCIVGFGALNVIDTRSCTFYDKKEFMNIQEAQDYQNDILIEAQKIGAIVRESIISVTSPPTVEWYVVMPYNIYDKDPFDFKYGDRISTINSAKEGNIIVSIVLVAGVIVLIVTIIKN